MERQIKFRGLRTDGKGWGYGLPCAVRYDGEIDKIVGLENHCYVKPETVGQFTGLHDRNGKEIYEGDWLQIPGYPCYVSFLDGGFHTVYNHPEDGEVLPIIDVSVELMQVIGNIHENK